MNLELSRRMDAGQDLNLRIYIHVFGRGGAWGPIYEALHLPHYSTDIAAAWEVVERLAARGWVLHLNEEACSPPVWICRLVSVARVVSAEAPTAPHAICLAALDASIEQEPNDGS